MSLVRSDPQNHPAQRGRGATRDQAGLRDQGSLRERGGLRDQGGLRGLRHQRVLRGTAAAVFATFVALASHMIGGGDLPTAMGVVVPLALSTLVCVLLAGYRLSLPRLSLSVLASQSLFHPLFSVFTPMIGDHSPANALGRHAMHHADPAGSASGLTGSASGLTGSASGAAGSMPYAMPGAVPSPDAAASMHAHAAPAMLCAHLVAAVLTIAMIYWSEALSAKIAGFVRLVLHALVPAMVRLASVPNGSKPHLGVVDILPRHLGVLRSPVLTRGPPMEAF